MVVEGAGSRGLLEFGKKKNRHGNHNKGKEYASGGGQVRGCPCGFVCGMFMGLSVFFASSAYMALFMGFLGAWRRDFVSFLKTYSDL